MDIKLIKSNLTDAINQTDNPVLLMEISKLFDMSTGSKDVVKLTKDQINELETAISQIENREYLTHEEAKKEAEKWLED
ncbi:MAG: hypothetical protein K8R54_14275 [Bacteroidales bacterium]|nr:hypothetical protein [Bacteroidales bacterium]